MDSVRPSPPSQTWAPQTTAHTSGFPEPSPQPGLVVGLLASPGSALDLTESLIPVIADRMAEQLPGARWRVEFVSDRLAEPPTVLSELVSGPPGAAGPATGT